MKNRRLHSYAMSILLGVTVILLLHTQAVLAYDVHRYVVEDAELRIYPVNIAQNRRQQHPVLYQLIDTVQRGTQQDLVDFVKTALYEMGALYEEEATRPRNEASDPGFQLQHWREQTQAFAWDLYNTADMIELSTPLEISLDQTGEVLLLVDDKPYLLNSPKINAPLLLDERILAGYCRLRYCDQAWLETQQKTNKRTITIEAGWEMTGENIPEYVTSDGLHFVFTNLENRSKKQIAALKVIKEFKFVAETLKDAKGKGVPIDWGTLTIKSFYGSYDYRIALNSFGDTVYLKLPELHRITRWQEKIMTWLHARVEDEAYDEYLDADEFLAAALK